MPFSDTTRQQYSALMNEFLDKIHFSELADFDAVLPQLRRLLSPHFYIDSSVKFAENLTDIHYLVFNRDIYESYVDPADYDEYKAILIASIKARIDWLSKFDTHKKQEYIRDIQAKQQQAKEFRELVKSKKPPRIIDFNHVDEETLSIVAIALEGLLTTEQFNTLSADVKRAIYFNLENIQQLLQSQAITFAQLQQFSVSEVWQLAEGFAFELQVLNFPLNEYYALAEDTRSLFRNLVGRYQQNPWKVLQYLIWNSPSQIALITSLQNCLLRKFEESHPGLLNQISPTNFFEHISSLNEYEMGFLLLKFQDQMPSIIAAMTQMHQLKVLLDVFRSNFDFESKHLAMHNLFGNQFKRSKKIYDLVSTINDSGLNLDNYFYLTDYDFLNNDNELRLQINRHLSQFLQVSESIPRNYGFGLLRFLQEFTIEECKQIVREHRKKIIDCVELTDHIYEFTRLIGSPIKIEYWEAIAEELLPYIEDQGQLYSSIGFDRLPHKQAFWLIKKLPINIFINFIQNNLFNVLIPAGREEGLTYYFSVLPLSSYNSEGLYKVLPDLWDRERKQLLTVLRTKAKNKETNDPDCVRRFEALYDCLEKIEQALSKSTVEEQEAALKLIPFETCDLVELSQWLPLENDPWGDLAWIDKDEHKRVQQKRQAAEKHIVEAYFSRPQILNKMIDTPMDQLPLRVRRSMFGIKLYELQEQCLEQQTHPDEFVNALSQQIAYMEKRIHILKKVNAKEKIELYERIKTIYVQERAHYRQNKDLNNPTPTRQACLTSITDTIKQLEVTLKVNEGRGIFSVIWRGLRVIAVFFGLCLPIDNTQKMKIEECLPRFFKSTHTQTMKDVVHFVHNPIGHL